MAITATTIQQHIWHSQAHQLPDPKIISTTAMLSPGSTSSECQDRLWYNCCSLMPQPGGSQRVLSQRALPCHGPLGPASCTWLIKNHLPDTSSVMSQLITAYIIDLLEQVNRLQCLPFLLRPNTCIHAEKKNQGIHMADYACSLACIQSDEFPESIVRQGTSQNVCTLRRPKGEHHKHRSHTA